MARGIAGRWASLMHPERIIEALGLPPESRVDQRVPKKFLLEHGAPTAADKRLLQEGIEELTWIAALKPANAGLPAFRDAVRDYPEISVLVAALRPAAKRTRLVELIHRAIPYPLVLIATTGEGTVLSLAHKRLSEGEAGKVVVEVVRNTEALPFEPTLPQEAFLASLAMAQLTANDLYTLYQQWLYCIGTLEASAVTGAYTPLHSLERAAVREAALDDYGRIQREIAVLRAQAAREKQMNRRVDLNLEIQRLEKQLTQNREKL